MSPYVFSLVLAPMLQCLNIGSAYSPHEVVGHFGDKICTVPTEVVVKTYELRSLDASIRATHSKVFLLRSSLLVSCACVYLSTLYWSPTQSPVEFTMPTVLLIITGT